MIDLNRLSNILNPRGVNPQQQIQMQQQPSPTYPNSAPQDMMQDSPDQDAELNAAIMQLLSPKDEQYDRFAQLLQMMPQRDQYAPGKGRRIAAALAGLGTASPAAYVNGQAVGFKSDVPGSLKVQNSMLDEPYERALYDWSNKTKNSLEAAKLENTKNVNSRIAGSNVKSAQLREEGIQRQLSRDAQIKEKEDAKTASDADKVKIQKQRADAYVYKTTHPNHKFIETNGLIYSIDPVDGKTEVVKDQDGDPIKSDKLGDEAKAMLQLKNSKELEGVRQENRQSLENTRELNREKIEGTRQDNRERTIETRAANGSTSSKPETAANKQTRLYNRALEGINKNPAWKDYISVDAVRKIFKVDTPAAKAGVLGTTLGAKAGGDPKIREEIIKYIYGDEKESDSKTAKQAPAAPKGWKYVAKPGGGWTAVEDK